MTRRIQSILLATLISVVSCTDTSGPGPVNCNRGTLAPGAVVSGTLAKNACVTPGEFADIYLDYNVDVTNGERYLFTVRSESAWQPGLELRNDADPAAGPRSGWSDEVTGVGAHSEILFVSPYTGTLTLRVLSTSGSGGAFTLRSQQCGGSSQQISGTAEVGAEGSIEATDCVIHDRAMDGDSAYADTYVVYLDRNQMKTIKVKNRFLGSGFSPAIVFTGPFVAGTSASERQYSVTTADSLVTQVSGGNVAGNYILAVVGSTPFTTGAYTLTVGPPAP